MPPSPLSEKETTARLQKLREICLTLPEVSERLSHGAPAWFVREKKTLANFWDNHHDDGLVAMWCAAPPGVQEELVETEPDRFYRPPYVGHRGWLGVRLDLAAADMDWDEIAGIVAESFRCVAPKTLVKQLDGPDAD